jgi:type I restriction enzyme S subunit
MARIVSRIEELFSEIDDGERAMERAQKLVERYRQSVLKAAVTGELTRDWRGDNPPNLSLDPVAPASLPDGWSWTSLDDLSLSTSYGTSAKCSSVDSGVPVLRIPNVRDGWFDLRDLKWAPPGFDLPDEDRLAPGDLLVVRTNGSENIIGVGAVVQEELPSPTYFASYLIRFRLRREPLLAEWVNLVWQSDVVRRFVREHKATSAGQYNISQSKLRAMLLPAPPEQERQAILEAWRVAGARIESALREAALAYRGATGLRQSVLSAAFSGQLVPQDPTDEPASALLARLAAQPAVSPAAARRSRPRARPAKSSP